MSLSEPPEMQMKEIRAFRLPSLQGEANSSPLAAGTFVLQSLDGDTSGKALCLEGELRRKADQILADAEAKRQYIEQQAYEDGFSQGQKDGQEVGRRGLDKIVQRFETMVAALVSKQEELFHRRERELVELTLTVSRKIIGRELSIQPEAIRDVLAAAFRNIRETERLRLLVHPQDYECIKNYAQSSWPSGLEMGADASITPGGFLLETDQGEIDGTLETRWAKVNAAIDKALGNSHED